ncbi:HsdM family class I SAM-dependent methyltransferase [Microbispora amethystogenes]|uniref:site-specific DNA-methyltransferase (adenine-specific) n=1 Tax=Microbispora amethystogenes TaxID=1427754 RepID=A0ABQ4F648_9ACTN|nr:class I SAM-dependent DNA methyltransferase [Microbispora amethystogenes]GIH30248.1 DNA methyltransferase [Microbispora amethystogenes]
MTDTLNQAPEGESRETAAHTRSLVDRLWSYCDVLRDAGVPAIDYVEQLTYLLFLKMMDEQEKKNARRGKPHRVLPLGIDWDTLAGKKGEDLKEYYEHVLEVLGERPGMFRLIFLGAQNKIQATGLLERLIKDLIGKIQWSKEGVDVKGDAYEELLARSASDVKSGAGQYFTPRPLIRAMVDCVRPTPEDTIVDPACGTGGFLLAANEYLRREYPAESLDPDLRNRLSRGHAFHGIELVRSTARLAAMNMLTHGVVPSENQEVIEVGDALLAEPKVRASVVLANPPFGQKSAITVIGDDKKAVKDEAVYASRDFWVTTKNKQLNFLQHIAKLLKIDGRAAVVLPDNVLFEGGAGETIRRRLLKEYDVHTLLRLPTGIFYAGGVKANVLFFERRRPSETPWTSQLWVYDFRTGENFTLKQRPLRREHLQDFVDSYLPGKPHDERVATDRFRPFTYEELIAREKVNLDISWPRDGSGGETAPRTPEEIAHSIAADLRAALTQIEAIAAALGHGAEGEQPPFAESS